MTEPDRVSPVVGSRNDELIRVFDDCYVGFCRLAYLITGDADVAEEIVMQAFVDTYLAWPRLRDQGRSEFYVRAAVVNRARTFRRRRSTESRVAASLGAAAGQAVEPSDPPLADVGRAVAQLLDRQRACVALRYYADMPLKDIAATLGCSTGTVKSQLAKAQKSLRRLLPQYEETL